MLRTLGALALFVLPLSAQELVDRFLLPNGNLIPGWTTRAGSWSVNNFMVSSSGSTWAYLTHDSWRDVGDCVIDTLCVYPSSKRVTFCGAVARHPGTGTGNYCMTKIQDNSSAGTWNRVFAYEQPGGNVYIDPAKQTTNMMLRTFVRGNDVWAQVDMDRDGFFEQTTPIKTITSAAYRPRGEIGLSSFSDGAIDTVKFYRGLLLEDASTAPKIGTVYKMNFQAPLRTVGSVTIPSAWIGMLAAGNQGFQLYDGRWIPLSPDAVFVNSLSFGWGGTLTEKAPVGSMSLPIPNDKIFVGFRLYACAVSFGSATGAFGIDAISNDHGFQIQ